MPTEHKACMSKRHILDEYRPIYVSLKIGNMELVMVEIPCMICGCSSVVRAQSLYLWNQSKVQILPPAPFKLLLRAANIGGVNNITIDIVKSSLATSAGTAPMADGAFAATT